MHRSPEAKGLGVISGLRFEQLQKIACCFQRFFGSGILALIRGEREPLENVGIFWVLDLLARGCFNSPCPAHLADFLQKHLGFQPIAFFLRCFHSLHQLAVGRSCGASHVLRLRLAAATAALAAGEIEGGVRRSMNL